MIVRHGILYFSARAASGVVNLITIAAYTHLLSPDAYGRYALVVAGVGLISNAAFAWIGAGLVRYLPAADPNPRALIGTALSVWFLLTLGFSVGFWEIGVLLSASNTAWQVLILPGILLLWGQTWYDLCLEAHRGMLAPLRYAAMLILRAVLALLIGVLAILAGFGAAGALWGAVAGVLISGILLRPAQFSLRYWNFSSKVLRELFHFGLPLSMNSVFLMVVHFSDRFLIAVLLGEAAAGIYAASYDLAQQSVALVMRSVGNASHPLIFRAVEQHDEGRVAHYLQRNFLLLAAVGGLMVVWLYAAAEPLSALLMGAGFQTQAALVIPIVAVAAFVIGLRTHHFLLPLLIRRATQGMVVPSMVAAGLNLGLNLWWIPRFGIVGAAWATLSAYIVVLAMIAFIGMRLYPLPSPWRDATKVGLSALVAGAVAGHLVMPTHEGRLLITIIVGGTIYAACLGILYFREVRERIDVIGQRLWRR